ncbi:hypothetical protein HAX54_024897 [Datura stramonium]|uniref:HECT-type E3 ubiquitin transferase n=1 Tax=Datura stramonium TaxID=4076 RepID=A0ABS8S5Q0_DATST|nr:hypothetical protein [Datura stramonium]
MRSTGHPQAWQLINADLVSQIFILCKPGNPRPSNRLKTRLTDFLTMTPRNDTEQASNISNFLSSCAPAALVMLHVSKLNGAAGVDDSLYGLCRSSLGGIVESIGIARWESNGKDVIELQNLIGDHVVSAGPIAFPLLEEGTSEEKAKIWISYYRQQLKSLHDIYLDLLEKVELCLKWKEPLVLKKVKEAFGHDDASRGEGREYEELHEMLIDRSQLLSESFEYIAHADPESLRGGLFMEFKNEEATGPGVLREWFFLACQAIFNPQNVFVACPNDRRSFSNPASKEGICRARNPNGRDTIVNSKNESSMLGFLFRMQLPSSIAERVAHFAQGFADIITALRLQKSFFQSLNLEDLDWMLHGSETAVSHGDWKAHTDYNGYKESDPQISWFWKIVGCMSAEQRKVLLFFWTSIKYLPVEGFGGLASRLYIYKTRESYDRLPSSHTCFFRLCFPPYPSMDVMQDRLRIITQEHVGCSFGTW